MCVVFGRKVWKSLSLEAQATRIVFDEEQAVFETLFTADGPAYYQPFSQAMKLLFKARGEVTAEEARQAAVYLRHVSVLLLRIFCSCPFICLFDYCVPVCTCLCVCMCVYVYVCMYVYAGGCLFAISKCERASSSRVLD